MKEPGDTIGTCPYKGSGIAEHLGILRMCDCQLVWITCYDPDFIGSFLIWILQWFSGGESHSSESCIGEGLAVLLLILPILLCSYFIYISKSFSLVPNIKLLSSMKYQFVSFIICTFWNIYITIGNIHLKCYSYSNRKYSSKVLQIMLRMYELEKKKNRYNSFIS